jgi:formylglycine-generating enzyme required for sulfatase activity
MALKIVFGTVLFSLIALSGPLSKRQQAAGPSLQASELTAYTETIPGSEVKFEMVPIVGGTFTMGSPESEKGRGEDEGPQHEVRVGPFWMGKFEVTWDEYDLFAFSRDIKKGQKIESSKLDGYSRPTPPYADESFGYGKGRLPAISITYHAAMEYCRWLSSKTGKSYRLPTEAEWEYAARAGTKTPYSFSDSTKLGDYSWFTGNSDASPQKVGTKKPNPWGLHDMHGNVSEWCLDQYRADFYRTFKRGEVALSPVLLPDHMRYPHVVRGGSWDDDAHLLRSAARRSSNKEWSRRDPQKPQSIWWHTEAITVGFRIVRPVEEQKELKNFRSTITRQSP